MIDQKSIEWNFIYIYIKNKIGLELSHYKSDQLQRKIFNFMKVKNIDQIFNLISYLDHSLKHIYNFLDYITLNHSKMFTNIEKWHELEIHLLPQIYSREKNITCWNPNCYKGAEAYSLAMILHNKFPGNHNIFCSDIDQKNLEEGQQGVFDFSDVKGVPHHYRKKYLKEVDNKWTIEPQLKKTITFNKRDLFDPLLEINFDIIICRNTIINFKDDVQINLYQKFYDLLKPGGILFIGVLEKIPSYNKKYFENIFPLFYQKTIDKENLMPKVA